MRYRIAVGSRDGKAVTEHFGGCGMFLIIDADSGESSWSFEGFRPVTSACSGGEHDENSLSDMAEALSDCQLVLVSKIGPPAEAALRREGIDVIEYHGLIEDAMKRLLQYYR
jgi:nitrogen fixation protein NifX